MPTAILYFVRTYSRQPGGDLAVVDNLELPNEEAAFYAASVCILDRAGVAVIGRETEPPYVERLLHGHGAVPPTLADSAEPILLDPIRA